jgi:hypothetical protein
VRTGRRSERGGGDGTAEVVMSTQVTVRVPWRADNGKGSKVMESFNECKVDPADLH